MKHLRFILPLLAFTLALGVVFANKMQQTKPSAAFDPEWVYTGGPINDAGSYDLATSSPGCSGDAALCSIKAPDDGNGNPVLPDRLDEKVAEMIQNEQHQNAEGTIFLKD